MLTLSLSMVSIVTAGHITEIATPPANMGTISSGETIDLTFTATFADSIQTIVAIEVDYTADAWSYDGFDATMGAEDVADQFTETDVAGTVSLTCGTVTPSNGILSISLTFTALPSEGDYTFPWSYSFSAAQTGEPPPIPTTEDGSGTTQAHITAEIPETGTLSVDTTPVKGEVFVDGASWGTAPQSQVVNVGIYTVTFGDVAGYTKPDPEDATVLDGETTEVIGTYTPITEPDFAITVNPTSGPVLQGESTTPTVTITSIDGYSETVSLSASGQPTNVSVIFYPTSGTPTFTSTMTINVEDAEPGPYTITITGTGADTTTHTTTYTLTVIEVYVHTETVTDSGTVNATGADTTVDIDATGNHTITVSKYESNPGTGFAGDTGKYIDVHIDDPTNVTEIEIRLYYTDAEIAGLVESSLRMHWCNGTDWVTCCTTGVNTTDTDGYSGYMWVRITSETTPSLTDLTGTPFGAAGEGTERPVGGIFGYVNRLYLLVYMNQWLITGILMLIAGICTVLYWRKQKSA